MLRELRMPVYLTFSFHFRCNLIWETETVRGMRSRIGWGMLWLQLKKCLNLAHNPTRQILLSLAGEAADEDTFLNF